MSEVFPEYVFVEEFQALIGILRTQDAFAAAGVARYGFKPL